MNKYELINLDQTQVIADISMIDYGDIYINATEIAKQFAKQPSSFLRLKSTAEYIEEILSESHYVNSHTENLVRVVNGGKYKGTWLHKELAYEFAGWCSALFRRKLHRLTSVGF